MLLIFALASSLATTPYNLNDGYALCKRHEYLGTITEEDWKTEGIVWGPGFAYCHELMGWWGESGLSRPLPNGAHPTRAQDLKTLGEFEKALGPYPWPVHAK